MMRSPIAQAESLALHPRRLDLASRVATKLPRAWVSTRRRRRLLFLALAAPGFFAVFGAPLHRNLLVALIGFLLFAAAVVFRLRTEPLFEAADAAAARSDPEFPSPSPKETRDA